MGSPAMMATRQAARAAISCWMTVLSVGRSELSVSRISSRKRLALSDSGSEAGHSLRAKVLGPESLQSEAQSVKFVQIRTDHLGLGG